MQEKKITVSTFAVLLITVAVVAAHQFPERPERAERPEFECAIRYTPYKLDNEPAESGLSAGFYAPGKRAYVGLGVWLKTTLSGGRIQLDPPGILLPALSGPSTFVKDSSQIWFVSPKHHQHFKWVPSQNGSVVPFAIEFGKAGSGLPSYFGRIRRNNVTMLGSVIAYMSSFYYVNENGVSQSATGGYEVLTCRSHRNEAPTPPPALPVENLPPNVDAPPNCINTWLPYANDDAPAKNGIAAGEFECKNMAYVGKGTPNTIVVPGRIQINTPNAGLYVVSRKRELLMTNGTFYLADNANYTYRWVEYDGTVPPNTVMARNEFGRYAFGVSRLRVNGHTRVGRLMYPVANFASADGSVDETYSDFELLVCDPWPKFKCSQQWNSYNASQLATNGLSVDEGVTFVGRGTRKCINNGCDFGVGAATASDGVTFLDDLTATPVNSNNSILVDYLVKDSRNTYKWAQSKNGVQVANAIELKTEGHVPFYIGMTRIDDRVFVGKVRPGQGLFFVDSKGQQRATSSYSVLTCFSPDASNGVWEKKSDIVWFGSFGCPIRMEWNYKKWRCVCRDEFRGLFPPNKGTWVEATCSYLIA